MALGDHGLALVAAPPVPSGGVPGGGEGQGSQTNKAPHDASLPPTGKDVSENFIPVADVVVTPVKSNKELFCQADIQCPGIALKKMKLILGAKGPEEAKNIIAFLGVTPIEKYRHTRSILASMLVGDFVECFDELVTRLPQQLGKKSLGAIFCAKEMDLNIAAVSWFV